MDHNQWLHKVGDIAEFLSQKDSSLLSPVSFDRQVKDSESDDEYNLAESIIGLAPTGDVIALIKKTRCSVLTRSSNVKNTLRYNLRTTIELSGAPNTNRDVPTSVLCLPIASQKVSTHGQAEWTCIAVGFRSGLVQMYTENGIFLFGQIFSNRSVVQLKCRTQHWLNAQCGAVAEPGDDFSILFADGVLVTIDGFGLFQLLRVVYAQQALRSSSSPLNASTLIPHNMLSFTKWKFTDVDNINDVVTCGIRPMSELNALFYATFNQGADITSCNQLSHFVTTGSLPFLGSWTGQERKQSGSLISDVTTAVSNKIMSSLSGILSWSRQTDQQKYSSSSEEQTAAQEPAKMLNLKSVIHDRPRVGQMIAASPNHRLAAVTDNFNRIYVIDLELNVIIKQFKGYREAQVGWVRSVQDKETISSSESRNSRATQFLVIHSPRRCQLEVRGGERWERIHMVEVAPNSRLIYTPHGMLGWTRSMVNGPMDCGLGSCYLISSTGVISNVEVAFHWGVGDRNRFKLLDQSLLRELDNSISAGKTQAFAEIIGKLNLDETRDSAVQLLIRNFCNKPQHLVEVISSELIPISKRLPAEEGQRHHDLCSRAIAAINLYISLESFKSDASSMTKNTPGVNLESILSTFAIRSNDRDSYRQIFETYCLVNGMKIENDQKQSSPIKPMKLTELMELLGILGKPGISQQSSDILLGARIFGSLFHMEDFSNISHQFDSAITLYACQIFSPLELLRFLLSYFFASASPWLAVEHISLLFFLVQLLARQSVSDTGAFWSLCHKMCSESHSHVKALTVALIASQLHLSTKCQSMAIEEQSSLLEMAGDWESDIAVSAMLLGETPNENSNGSEMWLQLSTQLTVLSLFEMLVSCKSATNFSQNVEAGATDGWDTDVQDISVAIMPQISSQMITESGVDLLCEHLCRWIVQSKFDVKSFFSHFDSIKHDVSSQNFLTVESTIDHLLARLVSILPESLSSDQLYAGCAWESAHSWSRQEIVSSQPYLLDSSLQYANLISPVNLRLKCWLLQHIWAKLVRPVFHTIFSTTLRLDRAPRDFELGDGKTELHAEQISAFTANLFGLLLEASSSALPEPSKHATIESVWPKPHPDKGRISLADQAAAANVTLENKGCLLLHLEAALVLRIIIHFRMKPADLDHMFSHIEQSILFQDLFSAPTPPPYVLDYVVDSRSAFILRATKATLLAIKPPSINVLLSSSYYEQWNAVTTRLIDLWHLDNSVIAGKKLAMLCCIGISDELVEMAEKHTLNINESEFSSVRFWPHLISVIGHHIARFVYQGDRGGRSQALRNRLDAFAPELVHWLAGCLNDQESIMLISAFGDHCFLQQTTRTLPVLNRLLSLALSQLPESYSFYAMTLALCELIGTLQEESSL